MGTTRPTFRAATSRTASAVLRLPGSWLRERTSPVVSGWSVWTVPPPSAVPLCGVTTPRGDNPHGLPVCGGRRITDEIFDLARGLPDSVADGRGRPNQAACGRRPRRCVGVAVDLRMLTASLIQVDDTRGYLTLALLVAVLAGLAAVVNWLSGLGHGRDDMGAPPSAPSAARVGRIGLGAPCGSECAHGHLSRGCGAGAPQYCSDESGGGHPQRRLWHRRGGNVPREAWEDSA
jgi:hypothetical protein